MMSTDPFMEVFPITVQEPSVVFPIVVVVVPDVLISTTPLMEVFAMTVRELAPPMVVIPVPNVLISTSPAMETLFNDVFTDTVSDDSDTFFKMVSPVIDKVDAENVLVTFTAPVTVRPALRVD